MQSSEQAAGSVSMIELKRLAGRMLPDSSALRGLILSEPDYVQEEEAKIKVRMYSKLLYREMKSRA